MTGTRGSPTAPAWASTQFPPHGVHGNPVELLVERGQEPDDNKIVTLAQHV